MACTLSSCAVKARYSMWPPGLCAEAAMDPSLASQPNTLPNTCMACWWEQLLVLACDVAQKMIRTAYGELSAANYTIWLGHTGSHENMYHFSSLEMGVSAFQVPTNLYTQAQAEQKPVWPSPKSSITSHVFVCPLLYLDIPECHLLLHHTMPCLCPQSPPSSQTLIHAFRCIKAAVPSQGQTCPCLCCAGCAARATIGANVFAPVAWTPYKSGKEEEWLSWECYVYVHVYVKINSI